MNQQWTIYAEWKSQFPTSVPIPGCPRQEGTSMLGYHLEPSLRRQIDC